MKIKESVALDMIMRANDIIVNSINENENIDPDLKDDMIEESQELIESKVMAINNIWLPSTNQFHKVSQFSIKDRDIHVQERLLWNWNSVVANLMTYHVDFMTSNYRSAILSLMNPSSDESDKVFGNYLLYKTFLGSCLFQLVMDIMTIDPDLTLSKLDLNDPCAYIFISMNVNNWWDYIVNTDGTELDKSDPVLWIRPNLAVAKDKTIKCTEIDLVDMKDIIPQKKE